MIDTEHIIICFGFLWVCIATLNTKQIYSFVIATARSFMLYVISEIKITYSMFGTLPQDIMGIIKFIIKSIVLLPKKNASVLCCLLAIASAIIMFALIVFNANGSLDSNTFLFFLFCSLVSFAIFLMLGMLYFGKCNNSNISSSICNPKKPNALLLIAPEVMFFTTIIFLFFLIFLTCGGAII